MTEQEEVKSLSAWRLDIKRFGHKGYLSMYKTFLGSPVSNIPRFYRAIKLYGDFAIFDAIVDSSEQSISGDPLNYVIVVAKNKWKETQKDEEEEQGYLADIEKAKKETEKSNKELQKKLKK